MKPEQTQHLTDLAAELVTSERVFAPRTPHTYSHTGAQVLRRFNLVPDHSGGEALGSNVQSLYPDVPQATVYYFPGQE